MTVLAFQYLQDITVKEICV